MENDNMKFPDQPPLTYSQSDEVTSSVRATNKPRRTKSSGNKRTKKSLNHTKSDTMSPLGLPRSPTGRNSTMSMVSPPPSGSSSSKQPRTKRGVARSHSASLTEARRQLLLQQQQQLHAVELPAGTNGSYAQLNLPPLLRMQYEAAANNNNNNNNNTNNNDNNAKTPTLLSPISASPKSNQSTGSDSGMFTPPLSMQQQQHQQMQLASLSPMKFSPPLTRSASSSPTPETMMTSQFDNGDKKEPLFFETNNDAPNFFTSVNNKKTTNDKSVKSSSSSLSSSSSAKPRSMKSNPSPKHEPFKKGDSPPAPPRKAPESPTPDETEDSPATFATSSNVPQDVTPVAPSANTATRNTSSRRDAASRSNRTRRRLESDPDVQVPAPRSVSMQPLQSERRQHAEQESGEKSETTPRQPRENRVAASTSKMKKSRSRRKLINRSASETNMKAFRRHRDLSQAHGNQRHSHNKSVNDSASGPSDVDRVSQNGNAISDRSSGSHFPQQMQQEAQQHDTLLSDKTPNDKKESRSGGNSRKFKLSNLTRSISFSSKIRPPPPTKTSSQIVTGTSDRDFEISANKESQSRGGSGGGGGLSLRSTTTSLSTWLKTPAGGPPPTNNSNHSNHTASTSPLSPASTKTGSTFHSRSSGENTVSTLESDPSLISPIPGTAPHNSKKVSKSPSGGLSKLFNLARLRADFDRPDGGIIGKEGAEGLPAVDPDFLEAVGKSFIVSTPPEDLDSAPKDIPFFEDDNASVESMGDDTIISMPFDSQGQPVSPKSKISLPAPPERSALKKDITKKKSSTSNVSSASSKKKSKRSGRSKSPGPLHDRSPTRKATKNSVTFHKVIVRRYERCVGDNPAVSSGPPIGLGWEYITPQDEYDVEVFETSIRPPGPRTRRDFFLSPQKRFHMLLDEWGYSVQEICKAKDEANEVRLQRQASIFQLNRSAAAAGLGPAPGGFGARGPPDASRINTNPIPPKKKMGKKTTASNNNGTDAIPRIPPSPTRGQARWEATPASPLTAA